MTGSVTRNGLLRCNHDRDSHAQWPRLYPCNRLAVVKYHPKGLLGPMYYCDKHAEFIVRPNDIVLRSPQGFLVKYGERHSFEIVPAREDNRSPIIKDMGKAVEHVTWDDDRYPEQMKSLPNAPDVLSCLGDVSLLKTPSIAIVGMQQPSTLGRSIAFRLAAFFARSGYTIISGWVDGIDVATYEGALSVGGRSIAVLGTPLGNFSPHHNRKLAQAIVLFYH